MGFNDFAKGKDTTAARPAARAGVGALTAFIDQGSEFTGKLSFKDTVRIDGRFEGEIASDNTLIVGETGQVHAEIKSDTVVISGEVKGDIVARSQITLHKTARVTGNLTTPCLVVEEGAVINGMFKMVTSDGKSPASLKAIDGGVKPEPPQSGIPGKL